MTGRVEDSLSGKVLERSFVYFEGQVGDNFSKSDGRFRINRPTITDTILVIRRIGYVPIRVVVPNSAAASLVDMGTVKLRAAATKLDRIAIEAEEKARYPHLEGFYHRRGLLQGFFMTPEDIASAAASKPSRLLERSVKVITGCNDRGNGRWMKGAPFDCTAQSNRPRASGVSGRLLMTHCEMDVWLDGRRSLVELDEVPVKEIVAIEVYSGPATTPSMFGAGDCGAVAIWTNSGRGTP